MDDASEAEALRAQVKRLEGQRDALAILNFHYLQQAELTGKRWAIAKIRQMAQHVTANSGVGTVADVLQVSADALELLNADNANTGQSDACGIRARCRRLAWDWLRRAGDDWKNDRVQGMKDAHYELIELVGLGDDREDALVGELRSAVKRAANELRLAADVLEEEEGKEEADGTREIATDLEAALAAFALPVPTLEPVVSQL